MQTKDIHDGTKRISLIAKVVDVGVPREVQSRFKDETYKVVDVTVADETGSMKLVLWNEQIDQVTNGNVIEIENGYATSFKGEVQLNVGKYGTLKVN